MQGFGRGIDSEGNSFIGWWHDDNYHGYGIHIKPSGDVLIEGLIEHGEFKKDGNVTYKKAGNLMAQKFDHNMFVLK